MVKQVRCRGPSGEPRLTCFFCGFGVIIHSSIGYDLLIQRQDPASTHLTLLDIYVPPSEILGAEQAGCQPGGLF